MITLKQKIIAFYIIYMKKTIFIKQRLLNCVAVYPLYATSIHMIKWFLLEFALYMDKC